MGINGIYRLSIAKVELIYTLLPFSALRSSFLLTLRSDVTSPFNFSPSSLSFPQT